MCWREVSLCAHRGGGVQVGTAVEGLENKGDVGGGAGLSPLKDVAANDGRVEVEGTGREEGESVEEDMHLVQRRRLLGTADTRFGKRLRTGMAKNQRIHAWAHALATRVGEVMA